MVSAMVDVTTVSVDFWAWPTRDAIVVSTVTPKTATITRIGASFIFILLLLMSVLTSFKFSRRLRLKIEGRHPESFPGDGLRVLRSAETNTCDKRDLHLAGAL